MHDQIKYLKWWNDEINSKTDSNNLILILVNVSRLSLAKLSKILRWDGWSTSFLKSLLFYKDNG